MAGLPDGVLFFPGFLDRAAQQSLTETIRSIVEKAPLFTPVMPRTGKPMSVRMTNCGVLGWVTDKNLGYRYQPVHPVTANPWPAIPDTLLDIWKTVVPDAKEPEACLVNFYDAGARMGLHQDRDETDLETPVVSISLGDDCLFRIGGHKRTDPTTSFRLNSGDVLVLGGSGRLSFHGVDRIYPGPSTLLRKEGRINLTLRRVTQ